MEGRVKEKSKLWYTTFALADCKQVEYTFLLKGVIV
jgi:hypothetical protein